MQKNEQLTNQVKELTKLLESAKLYMKVVDFDKAIEMLLVAREESKRSESWQTYLDSVILLIRLYSERLEIENATEIILEVFQLALSGKISLTARFYYVLGMCQYLQEKYSLALENFEKGLALAHIEESTLDKVYNLIGIANAQLERGRVSEASTAIHAGIELAYNREIRELKPHLLLIRSQLSIQLERYEEAKRILDSIRVNDKSSYDGRLSCMVCLCYGQLYMKWKRMDQARTALELGLTLIDRKNLKSLAKCFDSLLEEVNRNETEISELEISFGSPIEISESNLGSINLNSQHILGDLLELLASNLGRPQDKDEIVRKLWKCEYDPLIHDNKIYVTIKRLRQLIEPNPKRPIYLMRSRTGYFLNPNRKILVKTQKKGDIS